MTNEWTKLIDELRADNKAKDKKIQELEEEVERLDKIILDW